MTANRSRKEIELIMVARTEWLARFLSSEESGLWLDAKYIYKYYFKYLKGRDDCAGPVDKIAYEGFRKWMPTTGDITVSKKVNLQGGNRKTLYKLKKDASCYDCLTPLGKVANKLMGGYLVNGKPTFKL